MVEPEGKWGGKTFRLGNEGSSHRGEEDRSDHIFKIFFFNRKGRFPIEKQRDIV